MAGGRPRTVSLPPLEMIELGKEMVEWVKTHKPLHLSHWYLREKMIVYDDWECLCRCPEFLPYYETALSYVSEKYIDGTIAPAIANRFMRNYFKNVKREEDDELQTKLDKELDQKKKLIEHQAKVNADQTISVSKDIINQFEATMSQLSSLQRSIDDNNNINAAKSE